MAMMAITTRSSINVNAAKKHFLWPARTSDDFDSFMHFTRLNILALTGSSRVLLREQGARDLKSQAPVLCHVIRGDSPTAHAPNLWCFDQEKPGVFRSGDRNAVGEVSGAVECSRTARGPCGQTRRKVCGGQHMVCSVRGSTRSCENEIAADQTRGIHDRMRPSGCRTEDLEFRITGVAVLAGRIREIEFHRISVRGDGRGTGSDESHPVRRGFAGRQ